MLNHRFLNIQCVLGVNSCSSDSSKLTTGTNLYILLTIYILKRIATVAHYLDSHNLHSCCMIDFDIPVCLFDSQI